MYRSIIIVCLGLFPLSLFSQHLEAEYQFRSTISLVNFVNEAAEYYEEKGSNAFLDFNIKGEKWNTGRRYVFIYDISGNCVFHPIQRDFMGKNMLHLKDMSGKPVIEEIIDVALSSNTGTGWVHYLWAEMGEFFPSWKSAYIRKVKGPDGKVCVLGSGTYDMRNEKAFMVRIVDSAYMLLEKKGEDAYDLLLDQSTIFYFRNTYVFVIDMLGKAIVDPVFPGLSGRDLSNFQDLIGNYVVVEMIEKLKDSDKAFVLYIWPRPGETLPSKKVAYIRRIKINGKDLIVGSTMYIEEPIWKTF